MDSATKALLLKLNLKPFTPIPFIKSGKYQTIVGTHWPQAGEPSDTKLFDFRLADGDELVLAENTPLGWLPGNRVVFLVHGLTGSHQSNYMIRMARAFTARGCKVIRMNLRNCGPGMGKARNPYHCGISQDTRQVLEWLAVEYPTSPVTQIGFSLGANIGLKMAGEDGAQPSGNLDSMVAVSPPLDVKQSSNLLSSPQNAFFDWHFTRRVQQDVKQMHSYFPDLELPKFPRKMNLRTFDDLFTAPRSGFKNGDDYYERASSFPYLNKIQIPTLVIGAFDDPVVSGACFEKIPPTSWIEKVVSDKGGHVGFLGFGGGKSLRWADQLILRWTEENLSLIKAPLRTEV